MADAVRAWVAIVGFQVDRLAIELPQVYHNRIETDQNDLIHLAAVVGAIGDQFRDAHARAAYLPSEWKGQAPKSVIHMRMRKRLDAPEAAAIPKMAASKLHNVLDAVSIGLVDLGRM